MLLLLLLIMIRKRTVTLSFWTPTRGSLDPNEGVAKTTSDGSLHHIR